MYFVMTENSLQCELETKSQYKVAQKMVNSIEIQRK